MKAKFTLFFILFSLSFSNLLWAVPARPVWHDVVQPDGSIIELRQVGDEFYHFWQNRDGQEVVQNEEGYWVVKSEQLTPTQRKARRAASPMLKEVSEMRKAPVIPTPTRMLVILVNFSDRSMVSSHNSTFFGNMLNQEGYSTYGSVRDYFIAASDGQYQPTFDVFGPVTLDNTMEYYGGNDDDGNDLRPREMAWEACQKADALGCNFAQYDANNDGTVDNVYIIYAGYSESSCSSSWPQAVWPHSWNMGGISGSNKLDGKLLRKYGCSAELNNCSGTEVDGIGTFCHEFSHVIGMPDYYDTKYGTNHDNGATPDKWSLMDQGSYNSDGHRPPLYSIFDKCYMQWASMPPVLAKDANLTIEMPVGTQYARHITGTTSAKSYTSTDTIYYLENRQKSGNFDGALPGSGLLIWQVIYTSDWNSPNNVAGVLRYTVVSATGSPNNIGKASDPFPGSNNVRSKTLWPGCALSGITQNSNGNITFNYNGGSTTYTHTWMANGSQFTTTTSRSSLSLPSSSPSAWSGTEFVGWTKQRAIKQDGSDLVLAKAYDEISANTTFYAVYKSTSSPIRYFYQQNAPTYASVVDAQFVIVSGQSVAIGGQTVNTPGQYPYDTIKTIQGDSVQLVNLSWADMNKTIVYTAQAQLAEVTGTSSTYGLHIEQFGQDIMEHYFSNGKGVIAFNNNLTTIGNYAFLGCRNGLGGKLLSVQIPNTVTYIGANAFSNCWELTSIDLPTCAGVKIDDNAFYKCQSMVDFVLPDGVDTIGDNVFQNCTKLKHVTLSEGLKLIGHNVFNGCTVLEEITSRSLKPAASYSTTFSGITPANIVLKVWPSKVTKYSTTTYWQAFTNIQPIACGTTATITPSTHTMCPGDSYTWRTKQLTKAGVYRDTTYTDLYGCDTTIYQLTLTHYPTYNFQEAAIFEAGQSYSWRGRTITEKGYYYDSLTTSSGCDSVYSFFLVDSTQAIVYQSDKKLPEVSGATDLGLHPSAFDKTMIGHAFKSGTGIIVFNDTLKQIGDNAFYGCRNTNRLMTSVTLPRTITSIGNSAFYCCWNMTSINIPEGVTSIGQGAFYKCYVLSSITLPETLTSLNVNTFSNCTTLVAITSKALTPPACGNNCFNSVPNTAILYVWPVAKSSYETTAPWSTFSGRIQTICNGLATRDTTRATIPVGGSYEWQKENYTASGAYEKTTMDSHGCDTVHRRLELVVLDSAKVIFYTAPQKLLETNSNDGVGLHTNAFDKTIVVHTFSNGTGMIAFSDTLRTIGYRAFYGCQSGNNSAIYTITLPKTITSIGGQAFYANFQLTSITIPESVTSMGQKALHNCKGLTSITCEALTPPTCGDAAFNLVPKTIPLYVWPKALKTYQATAQWSDFTNIQMIDCNHPLVTNLTADTICQGDSIEWKGKYYKQTITKADTTMNKYGCDTVIDRLELTVGEKYEMKEYHFLPTGETYTWRGHDFTKDGIYHDSLHSLLGCDSVYTLYLMDSVKTVIYEAPAQLPTVSGTGTNRAIHIDAFDQAILSHTFAEGKGILLFADTLRQVGYRAFYYMNNGNGNLTKVIMPKTVTSIGNEAFYKCQLLTSVNIPDGITKISDRMLYDCQALTPVIIPQGVTTVEPYGLSKLYAVTELTFPAKVTSLGDNAMDNTTNLTQLTSLALVPPTVGGASTFLKVPKNIPLYVYPSAVQAYSTADGWKEFTNIQTIACPDPVVDTTKATICDGDTYNWREKQYSAAGTYSDTLRNIYGCDSAVHRLVLNTNPKYLIEESATIVQGMTYPWHTKSLSTAGIYYDSLQSQLGCDSVYKLTLSIVDANKAIIYTSDKKITEITSKAQSGSNGLHTYNFGQPMTSHTFFNGTGVIAFANDLTQLGDSAFYGCRDQFGKVTSITLPNTVTTLGRGAIYYCIQLQTINIPETVTSIAYRGLYRCTALTSIRCEALTPPACDAKAFEQTPNTAILYVWPKALKSYQDNASWSYFTNIQKIDCDNPEVTNLTRDTICQGETYNWREKQYSVAGTYKDTTMNKYGCDTVIYQLDLTVNPKYLFEESVTFVKGMTYVWRGKDLTTTGIYYDSLATKLGCDSVYKMTLTMTDSTKAIIYTATQKLTETTDAKVIGLHTNAFGQAIITHHFSNGTGVIAFNNNLTTIGDKAFYGCREGNSGNKLMTITIPNTVTNIGTDAFSNCWELSSANIPESVTSIGQSAFYKCYALNNITLPESLTTLGNSVFNNCTTLVAITSKALNPPTCGTTVFNNVLKTIPLYVWPKALSAYQTANQWRDFTNIHRICDNSAVTNFERDTICQGETYNWREKQYTTAGIYKDTTMDIHGCDTMIYQLDLVVNSSYLFEESATFVKGMTYVWRDHNLTATGIYYDSLQTTLGCDSVYKLTMNFTDSTKAIIYTANAKLAEVSYYNYGFHTGGHGQPVISHTFQNGVGVVAFENELTQLGNRAFYQCNTSNNNNLQTVILPKTVTSIGQSAFFACTNLTSVIIPDAVTTFGDSVFNKCRKLQDINIPEGVTTMGVRMLNECVALRDVTIPSTVTSLGIAALRHDSTWTSITCKALVPPTCGDYCFQKMYPDRNKTLYVYPSAVAAYRAANGWEDFYIQPICNNLSLSEEDTDGSKIVANTYDTIHLVRTLHADFYNTFCVPFAVAANEMEDYFGAGSKIYEMTSTSFGDAITINFNETANGIEAGVPYLMEVAQDVVNPAFANRTVTATTPGSVSQDNVTFQGVYCQTLLDPTHDPMEYFLASNNLLYRPVKADYMKGLRCYFKISNISLSTPIRMTINEPSTPTELDRFTDSSVNLITKLVKDNQLIIFRDGKMYNAQGQLMKH